jgi:hypothetical protein
MMIPRPLPVILAMFVSGFLGAAAVAGATSPEPAKASPPATSAEAVAEIVFYLARGEADACGRGCNEWIAAEGKIDAGAASRLRRLLAKLGRRRPSIYFHSPGGSVSGGLELGRLIRDQKLTVSVGHTIPSGCDRDKPLEKSCEALKRSGQELEAELDQVRAQCNSSCVYTLAGGTVRFVPPWVKLGIHDVGFDPDKKPPPGELSEEGRKVTHARIQEYLRDMGIDKGLYTAARMRRFGSLIGTRSCDLEWIGERSAKPSGRRSTSPGLQWKKDFLCALTLTSPGILTALRAWLVESGRQFVSRLRGSTLLPNPQARRIAPLASP